MRTSIKTMVKTNAALSGQRHGSLTFWTRDEQGNLRGIWVSGSTFASGQSILGIRMTGNQESSSGVFKSLDNAVELATIHGKVKARIAGNRIFVKIPDGVVMDNEPLPA